MKEILFRGRRVDNGEWVYGYYCPCVFGNFPAEPAIIDADELKKGRWAPVRVIHGTVSEYTSLTELRAKQRTYREDMKGRERRMTDKEKIMSVIDTWASKAVVTEIDGASVYNPYNASKLADALIKAGYEITSRRLVDATDEAEHRAEVVERAFDNIMRAFHELLSAMFLDKKIDLNEWKKDILTFAEQQLAKEKKNECRYDRV